MKFVTTLILFFLIAGTASRHEDAVEPVIQGSALLNEIDILDLEEKRKDDFFNTIRVQQTNNLSLKANKNEEDDFFNTIRVQQSTSNLSLATNEEREGDFFNTIRAQPSINNLSLTANENEGQFLQNFDTETLLSDDANIKQIAWQAPRTSNMVREMESYNIGTEESIQENGSIENSILTNASPTDQLFSSEALPSRENSCSTCLTDCESTWNCKERVCAVMRQKNSYKNGASIELLKLGRSSPTARAGIVPLHPDSSYAVRVALWANDWEAIWAGVDDFTGTTPDSSYDSQFTSMEFNHLISEQPWRCGLLEIGGGVRYISLTDTVSCPPYEQVAINKMFGPQGVVKWRYAIRERVNFFSRFSGSVLMNFVHKHHGDIYNDRATLSSLLLDARVGLDFQLPRGIRAHVAYQAYSIFNVSAAYSATPAFDNPHEGNIYIHGLGFGFTKQF